MADFDLTAYSGDCVVHAILDLPEGHRLSDFLNDAASIALTNVRLEALDDGRVVELSELNMEMGDICAVVVPLAERGSGARRIRTRTARVEIQLGPYEVLGHLHGPTSGDPLLAVSRRKRMIPLTDATIAYAFAGQTRISDLEVIVINRDLAHMVKPVEYEKSRIDDFGFSKVDPNAKDLTHELYVSRTDD